MGHIARSCVKSALYYKIQSKDGKYTGLGHPKNVHK